VTNKNKKRRSPSDRPASGPGGGGANEGRRERKQEAREAREAARKREQRGALVRRATVFGVAGVLGVGVFYWLNRAASPQEIPEAAVAAAQQAGCTAVTRPAGGDATGTHVDEGTPITYAARPATSGQHYGNQVLPSSPATYDQPIQSEPAAVHFMEHTGVMLYYRADGDGAASRQVVEALDGVAEQQPMTIAAPYDGLPAGTAVAFAAWDQLQTCPDAITPDQATTIAAGFSQAFACTSNAPEPEAADDC
jgi:hypothetical protein